MFIINVSSKDHIIEGTNMATVNHTIGRINLFVENMINYIFSKYSLQEKKNSIKLFKSLISMQRAEYIPVRWIEYKESEKTKIILEKLLIDPNDFNSLFCFSINNDIQISNDSVEIYKNVYHYLLNNYEKINPIDNEVLNIIEYLEYKLSNNISSIIQNQYNYALMLLDHYQHEFDYCNASRDQSKSILLHIDIMHYINGKK
ncbi:hypothetical protein FPHOBKDP_00044 [Listeria phage LPJP1]|nr:hypothetical protein FPHOBKDP_00044 [Listeria phage LPJP1]